ncbi:hypothetical protein AB0I60_07910 [Actinosynnema sp. NPDC050436]|uniref:hypothetical protein n=1 Tax=Actinosynnema sp. NPDC050436 TaxID=3155659 RepID=UPI0033D164CA
MTRRLTARIAVLAVTGALALAVAAVPASAAEGFLLLSGRAVEDPRGCYDVYGHEEIRNLTDENVLVFDDRDCEGELVQVIGPDGVGDDLALDEGRSAFVA